MAVSTFELIIQAQDKASKEFERVRKEVEGAGASLKEVERAAGKGASGWDAWRKEGTRAAQDVGKATDQAANKVNASMDKAAKGGIGRLRSELQAIPLDVQKMSDATIALARTIARDNKSASDAVRHMAQEYAFLREESTKALGDVDQQTQQAAASTKTLGDRLFSLKNFLLGIAAGTTAKTFFEINAGAERLKATLDQVTKGKGDATFARLDALSKDLNTSVTQLGDAFVRLNAAGLEPTNERLKIIYDTAQAFGGSAQVFDSIARALGQIQTKGKASAEELLQLGEVGINAFGYLEKQLGLTKEQLGNLGAAGVSSERAIAAILQGMSQEFGGAADKIAGTMGGMWQQLIQQAKDFALQVGGAGVIDYIKDRMQALMAYLRDAAKDGTLSTWAKRISDALIGFGRAVETVVGWVSPFVRWIAELAATFPLLTTAFVLLGGGLGTVVAVLGTFAGWIKKLVFLVPLLKLAIQALGTAGISAGAGANVLVAAVSLLHGGLGLVAGAILSVTSSLVVLTGGILAAVGIVGMITQAYLRYRDAVAQADAAQVQAEKTTAQNAANIVKNYERINDAVGRTVLKYKMVKDEAGRLTVVLDEQSQSWLKNQAAMAMTAEEAARVDARIADNTAKYKQQAEAIGAYYDYRISRARIMANEEVDAQRGVAEQERQLFGIRLQLAQEAYDKNNELLQNTEMAELQRAGRRKAIEKDLFAAKKTILEDYEKTLKGKLDESLRLEKQYADEVKALQKEIRGYRQEVEDFEREVRQSDMTAKQKYADDISTLKGLRAEYNQLVKEGDADSLNRAKETAQRMKDISKGLLGYSKEVSSAKDASLSWFKESAGLQEQVAEKQKTIAEENILQQQELQEQTLEGLRVTQAAIIEAGKAFEQFNSEDPKDKNVQIVLDENAINVFNDTVADLTQESTKVIRIKTVSDGGGGTGGEASAEGYASGGLVGLFRRLRSPLVRGGSGRRDDVPAMLTGGEFVMRKAAVKALGLDFLYKLNRLQFNIPKFADGGYVDRLGGMTMAMEPAFAGVSDLGSVNMVTRSGPVRVYGERSSLAMLKGEIERENLRGGSGA